MKVCHFCNRPITAGYYKTPIGNTYCCDCYQNKLNNLDPSPYYKSVLFRNVQSTRDDLIKGIEFSLLNDIKVRTRANNTLFVGNFNDNNVWSRDGSDCSMWQDMINQYKELFKATKDFLEAEYFEA